MDKLMDSPWFLRITALLLAMLLFLSAKSGVKCISVGLAEQGNRSQDIAAIRILLKMTKYYLKKYGLGDYTENIHICRSLK